MIRTVPRFAPRATCSQHSLEPLLRRHVRHWFVSALSREDVPPVGLSEGKGLFCCVRAEFAKRLDNRSTQVHGAAVPTLRGTGLPVCSDRPFDAELSRFEVEVFPLEGEALPQA